MSALLEVKNLTKDFSLGGLISREKIRAVNNVSFNVETAEIFTLAGQSGCGKTTTAKIILGFEEPTAGSITFNGMDLTNVKHKRHQLLRQIQGIFQNPFETFNPLRKVDQYFFETIHNYGLANDEHGATRMMDEALQAVGLSYEEIAGKYPSEFSGGQLQRASVARALLTKPSLLIADEPVSMVDASLRMSIVNLFKNLREEFGMSVLYITHDLATAYYVSDRAAIMFRGDIVEMGPVEKVLMEPKHPYTQLLRESIPEADPRKRWQKEITLSDIEHEEYLREGCKFAGRCPKAMDICKREVPPEVSVDGVLVRCHLYSRDELLVKGVDG